MAKEINIFRTTARVIGVMYVAGFIVGIGGEMLVKSVISAPNHLSIISSSSMMIASGALLWLAAVIGDAAHGVLMFPVLKKFSVRVAVGYLGFRIIDATFIAIMVLFMLAQIPLGASFIKAGSPVVSFFPALSSAFSQISIYAYDIGMMTLGVSGLMLNYVFFKKKLLPRLLAIWGLVGYAIIFIGMASDIMGSDLGLMSSLPGGLWELFVGFWLFFKGFEVKAFSNPTTKNEN